jgi:serine phosphatase RsbU (regulator of sigma subunit)
MPHWVQQMRNASPAFRRTVLRSEERRILGVVIFVTFFAVLAVIREIISDSAMSRWGLAIAAVVIALELRLFRIANKALRSGEAIHHKAWNYIVVVECLFPALGVAFLASTRLLPDYRPLATPWVLAFFPFILLSILRLSPRLCWLSGIVATLGYLGAASITGWHFRFGSNGYSVTQTAVLYFALVLLITGGLAGGLAAEIRKHVEAALHEAETRHQLKQVEHELQIARSIQQSLLPKVRPQIAGFEIAGWSRSADDTGGDFYDWKRLPDGRWVVVLADVTGHGIGPAMLASVCRAYSRASFNVRDGLDIMLKNINTSFAEDLTPERFATFVAVVCQEGSDEVEVLSAGHAPIFVYSADSKSLTLLDAQALPSGMFPEMWEGTPLKLHMKPGDMVMLVTDGFFEWENRTEEQFGTERLAAVVRESSDREPEVIIAELYDSVLKFAQGTGQQDDLTAVLIKRSNSEGKSGLAAA